MEYLCIGVAAIFAFFFYLTTKKVYNAGTIFLGYWAIITFLTSLNLDNADPVRQSTYELILLGLVSFAAGCMLCMQLKHKPLINSEYNFEITSYRLLNIVCIVIIVYSLYRIGIIVSYLSRGISWGSIRMMHGIGDATGEDTLKGGTWSQVIHDDFVAPWIYLIAPTLAVDLFLGNRNKKFILLLVISMFLYLVSTVSRAIGGLNTILDNYFNCLFVQTKYISKTEKMAK